MDPKNEYKYGGQLRVTKMTLKSKRVCGREEIYGSFIKMHKLHLSGKKNCSTMQKKLKLHALALPLTLQQ